MQLLDDAIPVHTDTKRPGRLAVTTAKVQRQRTKNKTFTRVYQFPLLQSEGNGLLYSDFWHECSLVYTQ